MAVRLLVVFAVIGPWLILLPERSVACSCGDPEPISAAFASADLVFQGTALHDQFGHGDIEFDVSTIWKGKASSRIVIETTDLVSCGYEFSKGIEYVVFVSEGLAHGQCDWTHPVGGEPGVFQEFIAQRQSEEASVNPDSVAGYPNSGTAGLANPSSSRTYLLIGLVVIIAVVGAFTVSRHWLSRHER